MPNVDELPEISTMVTWLLATGALGTAAFGVVDALKLCFGGLSNAGYGVLKRWLAPFEAALDRALGPEGWRDVLYANWINGQPREQQKAIVRSLIRLGLDASTAESLAEPGRVEKEKLVAVAGRLADGTALSEADLNVLGRLDAAIEARLDAAFSRAEQLYRNIARAAAGAIAVGLGAWAAVLMGDEWSSGALVGVLAVPLAPVAKDLAGSLSAAARAVKSTRNLA